MYDIIIIGAGPAGLTAAIYARRADKSVLVIEKETFGGQITYSPKVENYPGMISVSGNELAELMVTQAMELGAEIELDTVVGLRDNGDSKTVMTESTEYDARCVIIATGSKHRQLGIENENAFVGDGISYCAVCDGAFYKDKTVAVIGGGNSALQEAVLLSEGCEKVYVIQNLERMTGEGKLIEKLEKRDNVEFIFNSVVEKIMGSDRFEAIIIAKKDGTVEKIELDGIFVAIGQIPQNTAFADMVKLNDYGYIDSGENCLTNIDGVFSAGDCRSKAIRQVTTATGDGAVAALAACRYIDDNYEI